MKLALQQVESAAEVLTSLHACMHGMSARVNTVTLH